MSSRVYSNGLLREEWDDDVQTYRRFNDVGGLVEQRPYTAAEVAAAAAANVDPSSPPTIDSLNAVFVRRVHTPVYAKDYGLVADGIADDGAALASAITAAGDGGTVILPPGNLRVTTPVQIDAGVTLEGGGAYTTRIFAAGCNGINVAAGVNEFRLLGVEVVSSVRHSMTVNTLVGIKVNGTSASRPANHVYRDVYVDGFQTGIQTGYLWSSVFDNFRTDYGAIGIDAYGLSVNNFVIASSIAVTIQPGSRGIRLMGQESPADVTDVASEGWTVTNSLIYGGEIGVEIMGVTHNNISDNIIDFCSAYGVYIRDNGTHFGGNTKVGGNYIAMTGASGVAGIAIANTIANVQNIGNRIVDNHLVVYSGSAATYGIQATHAQSFGLIRGNVIRGFAAAGASIFLGGAGSTVTGNACRDTVTTANIYTEFINHIAGNDGTVYLLGGNPNVYSVDARGNKVWVGLQAHTTGTHAWGDRVVHARPAVGSPKAWVCTVAGTPGTWVSEGNL